MTVQNVGVGTGSTIGTMTTSALETHEILSMSMDGISRADVETTHLGTTGARTYIPGVLYEGGTITFEANFDIGFDYVTELTGIAESVQIDIKNHHATTPKDYEMTLTSVYLNSINWTVPLEDKNTVNFTLKIADDITNTVAT